MSVEDYLLFTSEFKLKLWLGYRNPMGYKCDEQVRASSLAGRPSLDVVVDCSARPMMELDKGDLGLMLREPRSNILG